MRAALSILIALTVALAPLHGATAALCADAPASPAGQSDACCTGGQDERPEPPENPAPVDDPCEGCDCALACCGVQARAVAPSMDFDDDAWRARPVALGESVEDGVPPERRPDGVRRPPRRGLLR